MIGRKDAIEVRQAKTMVGEVIEDAMTRSKAVDCSEDVLLFFEDVGVDGDIVYDLEFGNVVEWGEGCAD